MFHAFAFLGCGIVLPVLGSFADCTDISSTAFLAASDSTKGTISLSIVEVTVLTLTLACLRNTMNDSVAGVTKITTITS